jgi:hypothetical protein
MAEQPRSQLRARPHDMLAIVQHDQAPLLPQGLRKLLPHLAPGSLPDTQHGGDLQCDERRVPQRIELHQPDPIRKIALAEVTRKAPRRLQCESSLATPADPNEREEPPPTNDSPQLFEFRLAPDEACQRQRQVVMGCGFRRNHA